MFVGRLQLELGEDVEMELTGGRAGVETVRSFCAPNAVTDASTAGIASIAVAVTVELVP